MHHQYFGILLDYQKFRGVPENDTSYENLPFYHTASQTYHMTPFYMTLSKINLDNNTAIGYEADQPHLLVERPIPEVIHNRAMPSSKRLRNKLEKLSQTRIVFNPKTRYSKYFIHQQLMTNHRLHQYLPETVRFSAKNLYHMIEKYSSLYLKPISGSLGIGIIKLSSKIPQWIIQTKDKSIKTTRKNLYQTLRKMIKKRSYLIQETIDLATYDGSPYDIRVSVQKSIRGKWQITGMVGKVAKKGKHVTNVASGGKVYPIEALLHASSFNIAAVKTEIGRLSLMIAAHLNQTIPQLADIGLDIGVDKNGKPYFIEMNGRDLRYSFKEAQLIHEWFKTYENPVMYAKYLSHSIKNRP